MAKRKGAVHVATTTRFYKGKTYRTHLLRRTFRQGCKVKHETLGNLSHLPDAVVEMIRSALRGERFVPASESLQIIRSLPHGHVAAVLGTLRRIGLEEVLASVPSTQRDLVVAMIVARVIDPCSKLATARTINAETTSCSLGEVLGIEDVTEDDLYEAMDWLLKGQVRIENKLARKHLRDGTLVLYDVSSSYYTGTHCSLAEFGHNRDGKNGFPQIVYGLLCNGEGCPVAVEVFQGNTSDPATLKYQIKKIRKRFGLARVVLVGDRGMITSARIDEELRGVEGLDWISALRGPAIKKLVEQGVVQTSLFDAQDLVEVSSPDYPEERLVVCRNPLLAAERARKREALLAATGKELDKIVAATQRARNKLRGKDKIALRVGRVINRYKMAKHFIVEVGEDRFSYRRDQEKIVEEARLDGLYVIRTSVKRECLTAQDAVRAYKDLSKVEHAFRSLKTVDLKVRPIYHREEDRVRAHVFLCVLAYYVEWHMEQRLAPILFQDDDKETAEGLRTSIVAPAKRSARAEQKAAVHRTEDDQPVHGFRTLLKDLATIARNRVRTPCSTGAEFFMMTQPTDSQRRAFELLGASLDV